MKLERRLEPAVVAVRRRSRRLAVVAFALMAVLLAATGHDPIDTYREILDAAFTGQRGPVRDAHLGDADPLHGARRGRGLSHAALQHRR